MSQPEAVVATGGGMARVDRGRWIDLGTRILAVAYFGFLCWLAGSAALKVAPAVFAGTATDAGTRTLLVKATAVAFSGLLVGVYLFRGRPTRQARGLVPRVTALLNAVVLPAAMVFPAGLGWVPSTASTGVAVTGLILVGVGHLVAAIVLGFLGRSFSIFPEARKLVTHGPYAVVRHPLYAAELFAVAGIAMQHWSWWVALMVVAQLGVLLGRMHFEEQVLGAEFPEYAAYRARTKRLIPGVW